MASHFSNEFQDLKVRDAKKLVVPLHKLAQLLIDQKDEQNNKTQPNESIISAVEIYTEINKYLLQYNYDIPVTKQDTEYSYQYYVKQHPAILEAVGVYYGELTSEDIAELENYISTIKDNKTEKAFSSPDKENL